MFSVIKIVLIVGIQLTISDNTFNFRDKNYKVPLSLYNGESFPSKYLVPEDGVPTASDFEYYLISLQRAVNFFYNDIINRNDTDVNRAIGIYFMKAVVKKILHENQDKLTKTYYNILKDIVIKGDEFISCYVYLVQHAYKSDYSSLIYRVTRLMKDDFVQVYSIGNFTRGRLKKWIHSNIPMHPYVEEMDNLTLAKENYAYISESMDSFFVSVEESDECISRVTYNPEPINLTAVRPCLPDPYCRKALLSSPSVAYALSHRLLNIMLLRHTKRCYIQTEKEDDDLMDILCAFMYREAVYLARRGYFARDLFLEHVALCGLLGYEEFFRHQWFRKAASWIDDQGCIYESPNFLINRSRIVTQMETNVKKHKFIRKRLKITLLEECHSHPMALLLIVLAHGVRHALNFMK